MFTAAEWITSLSLRLSDYPKAFLSSRLVVNMTMRNEYVITTAIASINKQAVPPSKNYGGSLNTIFAGLSVLLACFALVIGLLQMRKHRKSNHLSVQHERYELEAGLPEVRPDVRV